MKYYSIRVVDAEKNDLMGAVEQVVLGKFIEEDDLCDKVLNLHDLFKEISNRVALEIEGV